ncbi:hypothetical protein BDY19DRAFT_997863 [Irpex rosettiformis]|uniref:Uncharacterized protein n=1 Tax=Irpex rosettiformis TaxID=378272 RepID=A0ACB8TQH6_9APHY|nr:hypothetical protein BDY19DRAFT_997863 [Irpex rosettiformis]
MAISNDLINIRKNSGCQESQETYRSRSALHVPVQQATIERLVQHHTFGNSIASIRQLYTATNEPPSLRLMKSLLVYPLESQPTCLDLHEIETVYSL